MKITVLVENTTKRKDLKAVHGLSLYIETAKHKILLDVGPNQYFAENAKKLGIDLSQVDTVILSHGHSDHGGGMKYFLELNSIAKIYMQKGALQPHYTKVFGIPFSVGLNPKCYQGSRFIIVDDFLQIDEELTLFAGVKERELYSCANHSLYQRENGKLHLDQFEHEQNLLIQCEEKTYLIGGCGHNGAVNILEKAKHYIDGDIDVMITGMHLMRNFFIKGPDDAFDRELAERLKTYSTQFYTLHCTGVTAFEQMKQVMGEQLGYLSTGDTI